MIMEMVEQLNKIGAMDKLKTAMQYIGEETELAKRGEFSTDVDVEYLTKGYEALNEFYRIVTENTKTKGNIVVNGVTLKPLQDLSDNTFSYDVCVNGEVVGTIFPSQDFNDFIDELTDFFESENKDSIIISTDDYDVTLVRKYDIDNDCSFYDIYQCGEFVDEYHTCGRTFEETIYYLKDIL